MIALLRAWGCEFRVDAGMFPGKGYLILRATLEPRGVKVWFEMTSAFFRSLLILIFSIFPTPRIWTTGIKWLSVMFKWLRDKGLENGAAWDAAWTGGKNRLAVFRKCCWSIELR